MRATAQLLAAALFCLPASLLSACGKVVTTVGETSELKSLVGSGGTATSGVGAGAAGSTAGAGVSVGGTGSGPVPDAGPPTKVPSTDGKCVFQSLDAQRRPLETYILLDSNISLVGGVWQQAVTGLRNFARDPRAAGTYVGLRSFGKDCSAPAYQTPDVAVDTLPNNADIIDLKTMNMGLQSSPMRPALEGGIAFESGRAISHPEMKHVVTVISDGFSGDISLCLPYNADQVVAAAADGLAKNPSIATYVLVIKNVLDAFTGGIQGLDRVAAAGGTDAPIPVDITNVAESTQAGLLSVLRLAQPCEFLLPANADPGLVGMALLPSASGSTGELERVNDAAGCAALDGWYFDDPAQPASMLLCPKTCSTLRSGDTYHIAPLQGCESATR